MYPSLAQESVEVRKQSVEPLERSVQFRRRSIQRLCPRLVVLMAVISKCAVVEKWALYWNLKMILNTKGVVISETHKGLKRVTRFCRFPPLLVNIR